MEMAYKEETFRKRVKEFVRKYVSDEDKEIVCVETLCFLYDKQECPTSKDIMEMIISKVNLPENKGNDNFYISKIVWEFAVAVNIDRRVIEYNESIRETMFKIAKSL